MPWAQLQAVDVRSYFTEVVLRDYFLFIDYYLGHEIGDGADFRHAQKVAEALLHLGDRLFQLEPCGFANPTEYRRDIFRKCAQYAIVCDVGLAAKHVVVSRGAGFVKSERALKAYVAVDKYVDDEGSYFRFRKLLEVELPDRKAADFGDLIFAALNALANHLVEKGVIPGPPRLRTPHPAFVPRGVANRTPTIRMVGRVGDRMEYGHKLFFYRKQLRRLTPAGSGDLLGCAMDIKYEAKIDASVFSDEQV